ncbi:MAG: SpoIID/LytB domain-containing protein [Deltaproteobacteria bacterium]|nr:SpoIID/LytB domain-containing protein [Deltaproteobacteria bacterium]
MRKGVLIALFTMVTLLISCVRTVPTNALSSELIRVAILKDVKELKVEGVDRFDATVKVETPVTITSVGKGVVAINGEQYSSPSVKLSSSRGIIHLNGRPFRGGIEIIGGERGLLVVNEIDLEVYLVGLINHEISSKWPVEVIKAQAVVARTYALYQKKRRLASLYHLEATVLDQVYSGITTEDMESLIAVQETRGEVLTYNGEPILAVYHSNSGGYTESSANVWGKDYPYLREVESPYDEVSPNLFWEFEIKADTLEDILTTGGYPVEGLKELVPLERTRSGRVKRLKIVSDTRGVEIRGEELRRIIGYDKLKSTNLVVKKEADSFRFFGKGSGHGVGLSQWGAKGMAEKGYDYRSILQHYYPDSRVVKLY